MQIHFQLRYTQQNWTYSAIWIDAAMAKPKINNFDFIYNVFNDIRNVLTVF
jgi:hypothetical protein